MNTNPMLPHQNSGTGASRNFALAGRVRRTALLAGLITAIVGGAATFAAADTAPTATEPPRDPYLGSWALTIDGRYAGPVASVDNCNLQADVVKEQVGPDRVASKHVSSTRPAPGTIEVGLGMSPTFHTWLSRSLAGNESGHTMQLVRTDTQAYALELGKARLATVTLPKIDRASTNPAFLKIGLAAESLRRTPAPQPAIYAVPPRGFVPARLAVHIAGVRNDVATLGPWKAKAAVLTDADGNDVQIAVDVGDLPLRVTNRGATLTMEPWLQSFLVQGRNGDADERSVVVTLTDGNVGGRLELQFDHAGLATGDLAARADGNRSYTLYAERVTAR
jgi:hypothetical protein